MMNSSSDAAGTDLAKLPETTPEERAVLSAHIARRKQKRPSPRVKLVEKAGFCNRDPGRHASGGAGLADLHGDLSRVGAGAGGVEYGGASDVERPVPDAWRKKHRASHPGRSGADATRQYPAWELFGGKPPADAGSPPVDCGGLAIGGSDDAARVAGRRLIPINAAGRIALACQSPVLEAMHGVVPRFFRHPPPPPQRQERNTATQTQRQAASVPTLRAPASGPCIRTSSIVFWQS
jgi:hypothetical protein